MEWERPPAFENELARLVRRDPDAIAAMVARYQHRLYRYLVRLVHDPAAAEDLFQQTWLKVVQTIPRYDALKSFEAWLFAIAHNLAIDHLRRRQPESLDEPVEPGEQRRDGPPSAGESALDRFLARERHTILAALISELPAIHREVLTLRFEEDMKLEEIAQVAGIPLSTVKSRLRRALEGLRYRIENRNPGGELL